MIDYTYNSNAIEGSTLTLEETALVLKEGYPPVNVKFADRAKKSQSSPAYVLESMKPL